ncbi:aminoglycoside phosphotransferase family protein [Streptomyces sp. A3M-1-3]|uniref:aminoglycoside phosphotransferase family protein n=1 Tax=Streptomyces sp. A3M-1-3 TaxID=2962044 RepID=UPI0020B8FC4F|nr:aminoglycoside phosphotransferase family protein [Streptomyces sp. A3M-1-3]MCP3821117.1 aminoglycoside phosphotransferase family protein [Streptomyces sp. A3M-1-3]
MIDIPEELAASQVRHNGEEGRAFIAALPGRATEFLERWSLRPTGPSMYGAASLVLPVERADGTAAALKMQLLDEESEGEPVALRVWGGDGAVQLLEHDAETGTMLLEWLGGTSQAEGSGGELRHLSSVDDDRQAVQILAELLARLTAVPAPPGLRRLGDIAAAMLDDVPQALDALEDADERRLLADCAAAVREVAGEPGDRLLHWDLHFDNVLAGVREPWLAIDPKPLAGDPGFDLMPALWNRFDASAVRWRFDLMTEVLGLDRERARAWTLGRVLQNSLWALEDGVDGEQELSEEQAEVARVLLGR